MLGLKAETSMDWVAVANAHLPEILVDHAHCEKKAAAFAMSMINRYSNRTVLVETMIGIATEELEHLGICVEIMKKRGIEYTPDRGNPYVRTLRELIRREEPHRLLDSMMVGALIEARSCERFSKLAEFCVDDELRVLYKSLLASEAGHYRIYTDVAREYFPADIVKNRFIEMAELEGDIVRALTNAPTMHG